MVALVFVALVVLVGWKVLEYVVLTDLLRPGRVLLEVVVAALTLGVK